MAGMWSMKPFLTMDPTGKASFTRFWARNFIQLAFQYAHEADPEAALYYNDYSMANAGKRGGVVKMVKALQENGLRIDGIGMQGHVGMHHPSLDEF